MKNPIISVLIPCFNSEKFISRALRSILHQSLDREKYEILSDKNRIREWKTPPQRGIIVDNFNKVLASNDRVFQLHLILDEIKDFDFKQYKSFPS